MNALQRKVYFSTLWPDACRANGWDKGDEEQRRAVTHTCMRLIKAPLTSSTSDLGSDQITALFCYLKHLAGPADLEQSARWLDCQTDYKAFNRARQADWHEVKTYGKSKNKLDRNRFAGEASAQGKPLDKFDPEAIRKRHLTMASRHQAKLRRQQAQPAPQRAVMTAEERNQNPF